MRTMSNEEPVLDCPRCWAAMKKERVRKPNIFIDVCPECGGVWLDGGELKKILGDRKLADYLTTEIGTKSESKLLCPRCGGLMDLEYADDTEVDVCLECGGVWLDMGELAALRQISESGFEGDELAKEEERWEDRVNGRNSLLARFLKKLSK